MSRHMLRDDEFESKRGKVEQPSKDPQEAAERRDNKFRSDSHWFDASESDDE